MYIDSRSKQHRKKPRGKLIDISSVLKSNRRRVIYVESKPFLPCRFALKSMSNPRRCVNIKFYKLVCHIINIRTFLCYLLIFVYLFCPENSTIDSRKTSITQGWLVVESCTNPRLIAFLTHFSPVLHFYTP